MSALLILATANVNFIGAPRVAAFEFKVYKVYSLHFAAQSRSPAGRKRPAALRLPPLITVVADCASHPRYEGKLEGVIYFFWLIFDHEYNPSIIRFEWQRLMCLLHSICELCYVVC